MHAQRITVAIVNDYPLVVEGLAQLLSADRRFDLIELNSMIDAEQSVDIVLFDAFGQNPISDIARLQNNPKFGHVVVYTWRVSPDLVSAVIGTGVSGYISKAADAESLCDALVRVHGGEQVIEPTDLEEIGNGDWPGRSQGLSLREAEVVSMITQGVTNEEIAKACYLSINSVKSYIRSAYRKMGVERRAQAVLWGVEHGMLPVRIQSEVGGDADLRSP